VEVRGTHLQPRFSLDAAHVHPNLIRVYVNPGDDVEDVAEPRPESEMLLEGLCAAIGGLRLRYVAPPGLVATTSVATTAVRRTPAV
jgi:hypothetical protein